MSYTQICQYCGNTYKDAVWVHYCESCGSHLQRNTTPIGGDEEEEKDNG